MQLKWVVHEEWTWMGVGMAGQGVVWMFVDIWGNHWYQPILHADHLILCTISMLRSCSLHYSLLWRTRVKYSALADCGRTFQSVPCSRTQISPCCLSSPCRQSGWYLLLLLPGPSIFLRLAIPNEKTYSLSHSVLHRALSWAGEKEFPWNESINDSLLISRWLHYVNYGG